MNSPNSWLYIYFKWEHNTGNDFILEIILYLENSCYFIIFNINKSNCKCFQPRICFSRVLNYFNLNSLNNRIQSFDFIKCKWKVGREQTRWVRQATNTGYAIKNERTVTQNDFKNKTDRKDGGTYITYYIWFTALILHWYAQGVLSWVKWASKTWSVSFYCKRFIPPIPHT